MDSAENATVDLLNVTERDTMLQRAKHAFRVAIPPTAAMVVLGAFILAIRWSKFAATFGIAIMGGVVLVVFLTYFVFALMGFKVSPQGVVDVPRVYAWGILCAIVISVFGVLFFLLLRRS